jgi:hypothetical protein
MPYIPKDTQEALAIRVPETAGELNWLLTQEVINYIGRDYRFERLNAALGALEACKQELYRRIVAPYEDKAKEKNGDAYWRALV